MIKLFKGISIFTVALLTGSCSKGSLNVSESPIEERAIDLYCAGIEEPAAPDDSKSQTKATIALQSTQIQNGAYLGVYAYQGSGEILQNAENNKHQVEYYTDEDDQTRAHLNPSQKIAWPSNDSEDPVNIRAYAPYQENNVGLESFTFTVAADQSTEEGYIASDFLYSSMNECKASNGDVDLMFRHLFSKIVLYLYEGNSSVVLQGATVELTNVATTADINLATGAAEATQARGNIIVHKFPIEQTSDYVCSAVFPAHTFAAAKFLKITDVNGKEYTVSLGNKNFAAGRVYTYGVNVKTAMEIYPTYIQSWEEGHEQLNVGGGEIQSMTFMSKFAEEYAIASYEFIDTDNNNYKDTKRGDADIELNYLVRPAAMAKTIANQYVANSQVKVTGYYAQTLTTKSSYGYDYPMTKAFDNETFTKTITGMSATDSGILTLTLANEGENDLKAAFYEGQISAKLAVEINKDETYYTTRYVQVFPKDSDPRVYAESINLNVTNLNLTMGAEPFQLIASVYPADVTTAGLTFESSDTEIVTVDATGKVTPSATKTGNATITVKANSKDVNGLEVKREILVEVSFVKPEIYVVGGTSVEYGGTLQLRVTVYPSSYQPVNITWSSDDESLATVDGSGLVTGRGYKNTNSDPNGEPIYKTVKITANVDGYSGTIEIKATPVLPAGVKFTDEYGTPYTMKVGQSVTFTASVTPDHIDESFQDLNWYNSTSDTPTMAVVTHNSSYTYTAGVSQVGEEVVITARHASSNYANSVNASRVVNVEHVYYSTFAFSESSQSIKAGTTITPELVLVGENGLNASWTEYTLSSSDLNVATVSGKTVTAVAAGTATITATYANETGTTLATSTMTLTVEEDVDRIGWYYYADGHVDESSSASGHGNVIGMVFSNYDATLDDPVLREKLGGSADGLVICHQKRSWDDTNEAVGGKGTTEKVSTQSYFPSGYTSLVGLQYLWGTTIGISTDGNKSMGYSNTQALIACQTAGSVTFPIITALQNTGVWTTTYPAPITSSGWYIPSIGDMIKLKEACGGAYSFNNNYLTLTNNYGGAYALNYRFWTSSESYGIAELVWYNPTNGEYPSSTSSSISGSTLKSQTALGVVTNASCVGPMCVILAFQVKD